MPTVDYLNLEYIFYKLYQLTFPLWVALNGLIVKLGWGNPHLISAHDAFTSASDTQALSLRFMDVTAAFKTLIGIFVVTLFIIIFYAYHKYKEHEATIHATAMKYVPPSSAPSKSPRWAIVQAHLEKEDPNEWRLAIMEADSMLEELVKSLGLPGVSLGDKLKGASAAHFKTLDDAWNAHKVRNAIAHSGSAYRLSRGEAVLAISRYENVFREFSFI